jgi:hypothetical protein
MCIWVSLIKQRESSNRKGQNSQQARTSQRRHEPSAKFKQPQPSCADLVAGNPSPKVDAPMLANAKPRTIQNPLPPLTTAGQPRGRVYGPSTDPVAAITWANWCGHVDQPTCTWALNPQLQTINVCTQECASLTILLLIKHGANMFDEQAQVHSAQQRRDERCEEANFIARLFQAQLHSTQAARNVSWGGACPSMRSTSTCHRND